MGKANKEEPREPSGSPAPRHTLRPQKQRCTFPGPGAPHGVLELRQGYRLEFKGLHPLALL